MKYLTIIICSTTLLFTACSLGRPNINGGDTDQPILDGWTIERAAEYWLASVLVDEYGSIINDKAQWLTPDSLSHLHKGHVRIDLPVQEGNPMPRFDVNYRQPKVGGVICFHDSASYQLTDSGDTLHSVGLIDYHFIDPMFSESADSSVFMQSRGKGLFTGFRLKRTRKHQDDGSWIWKQNGAPEWPSFIVSVYPGGDSLLVSRGIGRIETFIADGK